MSDVATSCAPKTTRHQRADSDRAIAAADTRERIIDAAKVLFGKSDFANVTLRDVAAEAGVSPGAITNHFAAGKEGLYYAASGHFPLTSLQGLKLKAERDALVIERSNLLTEVATLKADLANLQASRKGVHRPLSGPAVNLAGGAD